METVSATSVVNFLANWRNLFPDMPLTAGDLKQPHAVMMALVRLFERLGISKDAILMTPEEPNEHMTYYRDLLPVINTTRILNHIVSIMRQPNLTFLIMHLLQPTIMTSYAILMLMFNRVVFNKARLGDIAPSEDKLFGYKAEVKAVAENHNNVEAAEKGECGKSLKQLEHDTPLLEEELRQVKQIEAEIRAKLKDTTEEIRQADILLQQKKPYRDEIRADNARKKALKVHHTEVIKKQGKEAFQKHIDGKKSLSVLSDTLAQKLDYLNNLQTLKPTLDQANTLLREIMAVKDYDNGDLDADSVEDELGVLETELSELESELADARGAAARAAQCYRESALAAQHSLVVADSALKACEEEHRRDFDKMERQLLLTCSIKETAAQFEQEKEDGSAEVADILVDLSSNLSTTKFITKIKEVYEILWQRRSKKKF